MNMTIISKDGTKIVYHKTGRGPVIILVDGAFCSKDFGPMPKLAPFLVENFTVISYDRRARGESGDTRPYNIEREIEDLEALTEQNGGSAYLFGVSSGAILALRAVSHGLRVPKLVLFEPPFVTNKTLIRSPNAYHDLTQLIDDGKRGEAVKFYLRKVMGAPAILPFVLKLTPNWRKMKANANSLPYDAAICGDFEIPKNLVSAITTPVLVIDSTKSPEILRSAVEATVRALPNGTRKSLKGSIHDIPPKILAPELIQFLNGGHGNGK
jgi:pimeloyl-ACP methyl ester carboxylesterase